MESEFAQDIANRLGVSLQLVPVTTSNCISKLEAGAVDFLIATMCDTAKQRMQTGI